MYNSKKIIKRSFFICFSILTISCSNIKQNTSLYNSQKNNSNIASSSSPTRPFFPRISNSIFYWCLYSLHFSTTISEKLGSYAWQVKDTDLTDTLALEKNPDNNNLVLFRKSLDILHNTTKDFLTYINFDSGAIQKEYQILDNHDISTIWSIHPLSKENIHLVGKVFPYNALSCILRRKKFKWCIKISSYNDILFNKNTEGKNSQGPIYISGGTVRIDKDKYPVIFTQNANGKIIDQNYWKVPGTYISALDAKENLLTTVLTKHSLEKKSIQVLVYNFEQNKLKEQIELNIGNFNFTATDIKMTDSGSSYIVGYLEKTDNVLHPYPLAIIYYDSQPSSTSWMRYLVQTNGKSAKLSNIIKNEQVRVIGSQNIVSCLTNYSQVITFLCDKNAVLEDFKTSRTAKNSFGIDIVSPSKKEWALIQLDKNKKESRGKVVLFKQNLNLKNLEDCMSYIESTPEEIQVVKFSVNWEKIYSSYLTPLTSTSSNFSLSLSPASKKIKNITLCKQKDKNDASNNSKNPAWLNFTSLLTAFGITAGVCYIPCKLYKEKVKERVRLQKKKRKQQRRELRKEKRLEKKHRKILNAQNKLPQTRQNEITLTAME